MSASRNRTMVAAGGLAVLLAAGGLAVALNQGGPADPGTGRIATVAFADFPDCSSLLDYYRTHGRDLVGPYGLPGSGQVWATDAVKRAEGTLAVAPGAAGSAGAAAAQPSAPLGATSDTGTNVQVAGVDEADVSKLSGDLLLTVAAPVGPVYTPMAPQSSGGPAATRPPVPAAGLRILRATGTRATLLGVLPTTGWAATGLLVRGSSVLLIGPAPADAADPGADGSSGSGAAKIAPVYRQRTRIAQVDVHDPAHPVLTRTLDVDGSLVGARLTGGVVRVAVSSPPQGLRLVTPQAPSGSSPAEPAPGAAPKGSAASSSGSTSSAREAAPPTPTTEAESLAANRRIIADSSLDDWLPHYTLTEGIGTLNISSGPLLTCTNVASPGQFSGLDTLSLLSFDLDSPHGIRQWESGGVVATGTTLYATADHTYVATAPWQDWAALSGDRRLAAQREQRTWIHAFTTEGSGRPRYLASGSVPGFLLNQYALDEYRGDLRVASTVQPTWLGSGTVAPDAPDTSVTGSAPSTGSTSSGTTGRETVENSRVTVLRPSGSTLAEVGAVGGIGRGEQIRAVRFLGPVGYVVTFRQTDPLFTIDLSDPARPAVTGELKLLGYSAYLHPAGDGLLLGVGQAADSGGRSQGLQLSLFDVSDPAAPRRVAQRTLPGAFSDVEADAHAFTYADGLVLIPFNRTVPVAVPQPTPPPGAEPSTGFAPYYAVDAGVVAVRLTGHALSSPQIMYPTGSRSTLREGPYATGGVVPLRTYVRGGAVWTVTASGVATHQASTLRWLGYARFTR